MVYLNKYKQISDEAEKSLYSLVRDLVNKNTTNILCSIGNASNIRSYKRIR